MALGPIRISPLVERIPVVDREGRGLSSFIRALNRAFQAIATAFNDQAAIVQQLAILAGIVDDQGHLIAAQQAQIDNLQQQQSDGDSAISLQNSGVVNEAGPLTCTASGLVTIANHTRVYGNSTLNPSVSVTGGSDSTGLAPGDVIYVFYDDMARAGGAVTYQTSTDSMDAVQTGARHSVGSVEVPSSGTVNGDYTRPR